MLTWPLLEGMGTQLIPMATAAGTLAAHILATSTTPAAVQELEADVGGAVQHSLNAIPYQQQLLFVGVVFIGTLAISRFSVKVGIPAILGVLLLGLSINITTLNITHAQAENFHVLCLALLLFYAGLKTDLIAIRGFLKYGILLAVGGVLASSLLLGAFICWLSNATADPINLSGSMPFGAALLTAACLGSTDAGATLSVLRDIQNKVPERLRHLLEFESSVNDPSALLFFGLVVGLFVTSEVGTGPVGLQATALNELRKFVQQLSGGLLLGFIFGYLAIFVINHLVSERSQLLVVAVSIAFVVYGTAFYLGASGLIAIYICGLFLTNMSYRLPDITHVTLQEVLLPFNTMTEICVFLVFGLLVHPADLVDSLPAGLLTAAGLMLIARPFSVLIFQAQSPFRFRETLLISWCGLRGAVPLALSYELVASIPRLRGINPAQVEALARDCQSTIFIVVVLNLLLQGLTLPMVCRFLNLSPDPAGDAEPPSVDPHTVSPG
jgi:cell volume regulation protein A